MPFDSTNTRGAKAVQVIDLMLDHFGPNGEHWLCGTWSQNGDRCLISELRSINFHHKELVGSNTGSYIKQAIEKRTGSKKGIIEFNEFNDGRHVLSSLSRRNYTRIKEVLLTARELALADI